jgi:hypothetical protein
MQFSETIGLSWGTINESERVISMEKMQTSQTADRKRPYKSI